MALDFNLPEARALVPAIRQHFGWTQFDLSRETGIERSRISLFENGHVALKPAELDRLVEAIKTGFYARQLEAEEMLRNVESQPSFVD